MKKMQRDEQGRIVSAPDSYNGKRLSIRLKEETGSELAAIAKELGTSETEWAREAIEDAVREYKEGKNNARRP